MGALDMRRALKLSLWDGEGVVGLPRTGGEGLWVYQSFAAKPVGGGLLGGEAAAGVEVLRAVDSTSSGADIVLAPKVTCAAGCAGVVGDGTGALWCSGASVSAAASFSCLPFLVAAAGDDFGSACSVSRFFSVSYQFFSRKLERNSLNFWLCLASSPSYFACFRIRLSTWCCMYFSSAKHSRPAAAHRSHGSSPLQRLFCFLQCRQRRVGTKPSSGGGLPGVDCAGVGDWSVGDGWFGRGVDCLRSQSAFRRLCPVSLVVPGSGGCAGLESFVFMAYVLEPTRRRSSRSMAELRFLVPRVWKGVSTAPESGFGDWLTTPSVVILVLLSFCVLAGVAVMSSGGSGKSWSLLKSMMGLYDWT